MSFISYAQNLEDVMLWRALRQVDKGFYIDVGANDPAEDSVTKAFYDRGWRGINIEPVATHWKNLVEARPDDINLQCAAGREVGELDLWDSEVRGWASAAPDVIANRRAAGHAGTMIKVPVRPLSDICATYVTSPDIHFLKVDVEGFEEAVIEGMDFSRFRPWILIVESTSPDSTEEVHYRWETRVLNNGYALAYADGLNRFYVADERAELAALLRYPPNVFDDYKRSGWVAAEVQARESEQRFQAAESERQLAEQRLDQADAERQLAEQRLHQAEAERHLAEQRLKQAEAMHQTAELDMRNAEERARSAEHQRAQLEQQLRDVFASTSWRITAPMRWAIRTLFPRGLKAAAKSALRWSAMRVNRNPRLRRFALSVLNRAPGLKSRLRRVVEGPGAAASAGSAHLDFFNGTSLTAHGNRVYDELRAAYQHLKREKL